MLYPISILSIILLALIHLTSASHAPPPPPAPSPEADPIPFSTRAHWIRRANIVLSELASPCPFAAFGTVIVNHSDTSASPWGREVCIGVNRNHESGNPTLHGEISAINNCSVILTDPKGDYKLESKDALKAFAQLSLYTNAEPCPMCATAIAWSSFESITYGTNIETLGKQGWSQLPISSSQILSSAAGAGVATGTRLVEGVFANETDGYFAWQFDASAACPAGCARPGKGKGCVVVEKQEVRDEL